MEEQKQYQNKKRTLIDRKYLLQDFIKLKNKTYKALNIFEETNGITPSSKKEKKVFEVKYPLTYSQYVDFLVKEIEGIIRRLDVDVECELQLINGLNEIKHNLLTIIHIGDSNYYRVLRQKLFKILNDFDALITIVTNTMEER